MENKMTGLEALENIKRDMEYVTRLDFVKPIVRGEVQQELYKIYHRETPELDTIEKELKELEETKILCESFKNDVNRLNQQGIDLYLKYKKQTQILKILKEKVVDIWEILNSVDYNDWLVCYKPTKKKYLLTKEAFDLLKEWLNEN